MTHAELIQAIVHQCKSLSLVCHYNPDSRRVSRGFPDLVIAGPNGVVFAEVKTEHDDTTADQDLWLWTLSQIMYRCPMIYVFVWRPDDWPHKIKAVLEVIS